MKNGYSKPETLIILIILSLLAIVPAMNFKNAQAGVRDSRRKSDLRQIYNAMEAYYQENKSYPISKDGQIVSCTCGSDSPEICAWDPKSGGPREFCDINNIVYLKELLTDPTNLIPYCYLSNGQMFRLYAKLEVDSDFEAFPNGKLINCHKAQYNFGVSSPNTSPTME